MYHGLEKAAAQAWGTGNSAGRHAHFPPKHSLAKEKVGEGRCILELEAFEPTNTATNKKFLLTVIHSINHTGFCAQKKALSANLMFPGLTLC